MALNYNTFLVDLDRIKNPFIAGGSLQRFNQATRIKGQIEKISGIRFEQMSEEVFHLTNEILQQTNIIKRIGMGLIRGSSVSKQRSIDHMENLKIQLRALTGKIPIDIVGDPQIDPLTQGIGFADRGDRPTGTAPVITDPRQTSDPNIVLVEVDL